MRKNLLPQMLPGQAWFRGGHRGKVYKSHAQESRAEDAVATPLHTLAGVPHGKGRFRKLREGGHRKNNS